MSNIITQNYFNNIKNFILKAGIMDEFEVIPIKKGGNNRAWIVKTKYKKYFLKQYFTSKYDTRDRFGNEISFSMFAWKQGIRNIAAPIAADKTKLLGLFSYIEGRQPLKTDISDNMLKLALKFVEDLNLNITEIRCQTLSNASEACFTLSDHFDNVRKRINQLKNIDMDYGDHIDRDAKQFVMDVLSPKWEKTKSETKEKIMTLQLDLIKNINQYEMIISPSDFGFHNTILTKQKKLFFVDFEYAGWDNPVKLICDFFCQPEIPVPINHFKWFAKNILNISIKDPEKISQFFHLALYLLPLYRLKWCCIILNDFIPVDRDRRNFSLYNLDRRRIQLSKAVNYIQKSYKI